MDDTDCLNSFVEFFPENVELTTVFWHNPDLLNIIKKIKFKGIILSGSNYRILHKNVATISRKIFDFGIPILGICYGFQWMMKNLDQEIGTFPKDELKEYDKFLTIDKPFAVPKKLYKFSHHDYVKTIPSNWKIETKVDDMIYFTYEPNTKNIGIQFHPEKHKESGKAFYTKWIEYICKYTFYLDS
jgi:GMP synthase (glutamine-hydrolysing)